MCSLQLSAILTVMIITSSTDSSFRIVDSGGNTVTDGSLGLLLWNDGTVCDDRFTNNSAHAICRDMGYYPAISWEKSQYPYSWSVQASYSIKLDEVKCTYPYWRWDSCTYKTTHNCAHSEDVFLSCTPITKACPSGMYYYNTCTMCPSNTYSSSPGIRRSCTSCPTSSTSNPGSTYCNCKAGMYWNSDRCQSCSSGSASQQGALQCARCPAGSSAVNIGASCSCSAGLVWEWHSPWHGSSSGFCRLCFPGTYKNKQSQECTICPPGSTSSAGTNHCICKAGMYWNTTRCQTCPLRSASQEGALQCVDCPSNSLALKNGSSCSCPTGKEWNWDKQNTSNGSCELCLSGTYKNEETISCTVCPQGLMSTAGSDHCICPAGKLWNQNECRYCEYGTASPEGVLKCQVCPPGSSADLGSTSCSCPLGKSWIWSVDRTGSCRTSPIGLTTVILLCTSLALALISFTLTLLLIFERRRKQKEASNKVVYRRDGDNVEIQGNEVQVGSNRCDGVVDEEVYHNIEAEENNIYSDMDEL